MLLNNIQFINKDQPCCIHLRDGKIVSVTDAISTKASQTQEIHFENALAFPGLINSHDHLDFNCFPTLGQSSYSNYRQWAQHIHQHYATEINSILAIPETLRTQWGLYKNLLTGVTTVVNHGKKLQLQDPPIRVVQPSQNLHSAGFEKNWRIKLNHPAYLQQKCVIHAGEGTDKSSAAEIDQLIRWNLFRRPLVGIHAVAMTARQARHFAGIVWCPDSNNFLLNTQPLVIELKKNSTMVLGTDSTLTANWNTWEHLRMARNTKMATDRELFEMVTSNPSQLWQLPTGKIEAGYAADITITRTRNNNWDDFYNTNPEDILMVISEGKIRLFDESLIEQIQSLRITMKDFFPIKINTGIKYVFGNINALIDQLKLYNSTFKIPVEPMETNIVSVC